MECSMGLFTDGVREMHVRLDDDLSDRLLHLLHTLLYLLLAGPSAAVVIFLKK